MKFELFDYQEEAADKIARSLIRAVRDYAEDSNEQSAVALAAPTGAGKTVIATAVVEASLDGDEATPGIDEATFLWVTDDPSLNRQTLQKMMAASSALAPNRLITIENDFDAELFDAGRVYFLNIQKLGTSANLSKSGVDGRTWSLWQTIANTVEERPQGFIVIIDEAHRGMGTASSSSARDTIVAQIIGGGSTGRPAAPVVWGISATPRRFVSAMTELGRSTKAHTVSIEDVRASGLLKDQIILGHTRGVDAAESTLVRHAVRRVRQYEAKWSAYTTANSEPPVLPALVVQIPDKPSEQDLADLIGTVFEEWPELNSGHVVHVFGDHSDLQVGHTRIAWCPPEDIQDRPDVRVVLCKTAITTGWDCPRAEVLLSLRVARDMDLITQVMGRMVRTPLARRVHTDEDLNAVHCILPKFDQTAVDAIADRFKAGDESSLTGGTAVVVNAVELTRNPTLAAATATAPAVIVPVQQPGASTDGDHSPDFALEEPPAQGPVSDAPPAPNAAMPPPAVVPADGIPAVGLFGAMPGDQDLEAAASNDVFALVAALPSYTIPRRTLRSSVARLTSLALLLSTIPEDQPIQVHAQNQARNELLAVIDTFKANLEGAGEWDDLLQAAKHTRLFEHALEFGSPGVATVNFDTAIPLDARGIGILMNRARAALPEGLANAYVNRLAPADAQVPSAMIATIALASVASLKDDIETRASQVLEDWFNRYASAITRLPAAEQERFDRIKRESDRPLLTAVSIPTRRTEDAEGEAWERHLLSDAEGNYRIALKDWEAHVLRSELDAGAIAWYRNPSTGRHSLQIPYTSTLGISGMAPDFIFIHEIGGALAPSIVDPHGTHLSDAVPKLQGLSAYAGEHAAHYQRVQSVSKVDGVYRMLNHLDPDVREAVANYSGTDAASLFRSHGVNY